MLLQSDHSLQALSQADKQHLRSLVFTPGGYTVVVTDANGCTGTAAGTVNAANGPVHNVNTNQYYCTIQAAIDAATTLGGHVITAAAGSYNEDVSINKSITLTGAGAGTTTISGPIGGPGTTVQIAANNVNISGFTITRAGNNTTDWNNPGLNSAGIAIQGILTGSVIHDNIITGNRSGIDVNNSNGHSMHNTIINNRTGLIFRNQTDNMIV